jgi:hypothetical protein
LWRLARSLQRGDSAFTSVTLREKTQFAGTRHGLCAVGNV